MTDEANVQVKNFPSVMAPLMKPHTKSRGSTKRVGVLISGSGTNLQALIDHVVDPNKGSMAEIALVISNKPDAQGKLINPLFCKEAIIHERYYYQIMV